MGPPLSPQEQNTPLHGPLQHRADHLPRVVSWAVLQKPLKQLEAKLDAAMKAIGHVSDNKLQPHQRARLNLPHRHAGFGIQRFDKEVADAAFLSAAAPADKSMARGSPELWPFSNPCAADLRTRRERVCQAYPITWLLGGLRGAVRLVHLVFLLRFTAVREGCFCCRPCRLWHRWLFV